MAYSERIKNFNRIREDMRDFYVYGFKSRDEFTRKSARSYDDERRRMESLLGDYMRFRRTPDGKTFFLSIDSRASRHNPLFRAWRAKSFTDGDITLHFLLLDLLASAPHGAELSQLVEDVGERLPSDAKFFDDSTIRKKLNEYVSEGVVRAEKEGKRVRYFLAESCDLSSCADLLDFFSEVAPCGVLGSFLSDKTEPHSELFTFKHHFITDALDSEILCNLFDAMHGKRAVTLEIFSRKNEKATVFRVVPLRVMIGVQSGRQNLMAYVSGERRICSFRLDRILSVTPGEVCTDFDRYRRFLDGMMPHLFGVGTQNRLGKRLEHVEFTVRFADFETFIPQRLEREKRCGTVERLDENTCRFSADVFNAEELVPWIRTFLCRITQIQFSDPDLQKQFLRDVDAMYEMYGVSQTKGGDGDVLQ